MLDEEARDLGVVVVHRLGDGGELALAIVALQAQEAFGRGQEVEREVERLARGGRGHHADQAQAPGDEAEAGAEAQAEVRVAQQLLGAHDHAAGLGVGDAEVDALEVSRTEAESAAQRRGVAVLARYLVRDVAHDQRLRIGAVGARRPRGGSLDVVRQGRRGLATRQDEPPRPARAVA